MALDGSALTTLSTVKDELGISGSTEDSRLERYITTASSLLVQMIGRDLHYREAVAEKVPSSGDVRLVVQDALPIDAIDSIVRDDGDTEITEDSDRYRIENAGAGFIERINGRWHSTEVVYQNITPTLQGRQLDHFTVTYGGGWVTPEQASQGTYSPRTLPYDIEQAVIDYVVMRDAQQGKDPSVASKRVSKASVTYLDGGQRVPHSFSSVVQRYEIPEVL